MIQRYEVPGLPGADLKDGYLPGGILEVTREGGRITCEVIRRSIVSGADVRMGARECDEAGLAWLLDVGFSGDARLLVDDVTFRRVNRPSPLDECDEHEAIGPTGATLAISECSNHGGDCYGVSKDGYSLADHLPLEEARRFCVSMLSHQNKGIAVTFKPESN